MLTALTAPLFWLAFGLGALALLAIAWRRRLRWRPAWPLRLALLGLAALAALLPQAAVSTDPPPDRQVLILDQSDSIPPLVRETAGQQARQWQAGGPNRMVILMGAEALAASGTVWPAVDGRDTDLAGALDLAADALGGGSGRVILATDGVVADPLAAQEALGRLPPGGAVSLELLPLAGSSDPADLFAGRFYLPSAMWEHTPFRAVLPVYLGRGSEFVLRLAVNGQLVLEETYSLPAGQHLIPIELQTTVSEIMTLEAEILSALDPRPQNNRTFAALQVFPAPRVLIVTQNASRASGLAGALSAEGLDSDLMTPDDLPASLSALSPYQAVILHNFLASQLTQAQAVTLKDFAGQLGRGLIFIGGRSAYTLGGYKDTVLESILPVRLAPPPRSQDSALTFVLAFDRSASMGPLRVPPQLRPIVLAREAAIRAVETLGVEDYLGILTYNTSSQWTIPLGPVGDGLALQQTKDAIGQVTAAGGTSIFKALTAALEGMRDLPTTETRHLLLLSDGQSADGTLDEFVALASQANQEGITISTIALGVEADRELMARIAEAGDGRYYPVEQATELPRILIDESRAARGENVHEGTAFPIQGEPDHPVLSGMTVATMPPLAGYNALQSKADLGAEDVLLSANFEDPLLSVWQVGLGRVAAWTGDLGEEWAGEWTGWAGWEPMWSQLVRYTLPDPAFGPGQVEVEVGPAGLQVTAQVRSTAGLPRGGVPVQFSFVGPDGQLRAYAMPQVGPGTYRTALERPPEGVYRGVVLYEDEDGFPVELAAPLVVDYPREWQPEAQPEAVEFVGATLAWEQLLAGTSPSGPAGAPSEAVFQRLILALVLLWPLEIAIRRRWMPWRG